MRGKLPDLIFCSTAMAFCTNFVYVAARASSQSLSDSPPLPSRAPAAVLLALFFVSSSLSGDDIASPAGTSITDSHTASESPDSKPRLMPSSSSSSSDDCIIPAVMSRCRDKLPNPSCSSSSGDCIIAHKRAKSAQRCCQKNTKAVRIHQMEKQKSEDRRRCAGRCTDRFSHMNNVELLTY